MMGTVAWSPGDNEQKRFSTSLKTKAHASCHDCNQRASYPMAMGVNKGHKMIKDTIGSRDASPSPASSCRTWSGRCEASVPTNSKQRAREVLKHQRTNARSSIKKRVGTHICNKRRQEELNNLPKMCLLQWTLMLHRLKTKTNKQTKKQKQRAFYKVQVNANLHF